MEEDIKVLECENIGDLAVVGLIDLLNKENDYDLNKLKKQAIENLIKEYREKEERNKTLNESQKIKIKRMQELEKENIGLKRTINDLDNERLTEKLCRFNKCNEYWISKIEKKIEKIDKAIPKAQGEELLILEAKKDFAQELLEEE